MGYLIFDTEKEALEAEREIAKKKGLPKYGTRKDGTANPKVIIDTYAIPFQDEKGKWCIPEDEGE